MDKEYLKEATKVIESKFPDNSGFILMVTPFGDGNGRRLVYTSNMTRESAINTIKEWLIMASGEEEWLKHIK